MTKRDAPTEKLAAIELTVLLHEAVDASEPDRETVQLIPLVEEPEPPKLARGTEPSSVIAPRPRLPRTNLRLDELRREDDEP